MSPKALTPSATVFGDGMSKEVIKVQWNPEGGSQSAGTGVLLRRPSRELTPSYACTMRGRGNTRRRPSPSQGEGSHQKQTLLLPWLETPSLWNYQKVNPYCFSCPVCGILLWWPQPTGTERSWPVSLLIRSTLLWVLHWWSTRGFSVKSLHGISY